MEITPHMANVIWTIFLFCSFVLYFVVLIRHHNRIKSKDRMKKNSWQPIQINCDNCRRELECDYKTCDLRILEERGVYTI